MGDRRNRRCSSYRCWRCGFAFYRGFISLEKGEQHRRQFQAEQDSGRWDFGDQPALFAVAQGIVKNDPDAIRAAAKGVPDLQAPGRDGRDAAQLRCNAIVAAPGISRCD